LTDPGWGIQNASAIQITESSLIPINGLIGTQTPGFRDLSSPDPALKNTHPGFP
jgi:hypothetical protein